MSAREVDGRPRPSDPSGDSARQVVARALYEGEARDGHGMIWPTWDGLPPEVQDEYRERAAPVLAALAADPDTVERAARNLCSGIAGFDHCVAASVHRQHARAALAAALID